MIGRAVRRAGAAGVRGFLEQVPRGSFDPIMTMNQRFQADKDPRKISLVIGAYRTDEGKPYVFNVVKQIEKDMVKEELDKEYLPIEGDPEFIKAAQKIAFGDLLGTRSVATVQSLSGAGAVYIGTKFLQRFLPADTTYCYADPIWPLHIQIWSNMGVTNVTSYPYYDNEKRCMDFEGMIRKIKGLKPKSVVVLHPCAQNPTGIDPSLDQWREILHAIKQREHFPFLDMAYQGFASGDLRKDSQAVELFMREDLDMLLTQSFAKNAGLYGERIGACHFVTRSPQAAENIVSQLKLIIRCTYSNNPVHGARIVTRLVNNPEYFQMWQDELKLVSGRILRVRQQLLDKLVSLKTPGNWEHIVKQIGMFSYTGLSPSQCRRLMDKYRIYLLESGRVSLSGINSRNLDYIANAIHDVVTHGS